MKLSEMTIIDLKSVYDWMTSDEYRWDGSTNEMITKIVNEIEKRISEIEV